MTKTTKKYTARIYLKKGNYPVQIDKFFINAKNKTEAKRKSKIILRKQKTYPMSWYMIDII